MSHDQLVGYAKEIQSCLINTFGKIKIPNDEVVEITKISEIPVIAAKIRKYRYGPKLKIHGESITTQFRAGYHGGKSQYVESLFINFGNNHSYNAMNKLFMDPIDDEKNQPESLSTLIKKMDLKQEAIFLNTEKMIEEMGEPTMKVTRDLFQIDKPGKVTVGNDYQNLSTKSVHNSKENSPQLFSTKIQQDVQSFSSALLKVAEPTLSNRLLAIWFLAESFRYPPMLFYSLVVLHCYMNGYISLEELSNGFHPSQQKGSQQLQFFCYGLGSSYSHEYLKSTPEKPKIEVFQNANHAVLKVLYKKIEDKLRTKNYSEEELLPRAAIMFNLHIRYYLRLCGVDLNHVINFDWKNDTSIRDAYL